MHGGCRRPQSEPTPGAVTGLSPRRLQDCLRLTSAAPGDSSSLRPRGSQRCLPQRPPKGGRLPTPKGASTHLGVNCPQTLIFLSSPAWSSWKTQVCHQGPRPTGLFFLPCPTAIHTLPPGPQACLSPPHPYTAWLSLAFCNQTPRLGGQLPPCNQTGLGHTSDPWYQDRKATVRPG